MVLAAAQLADDPMVNPGTMIEQAVAGLGHLRIVVIAQQITHHQRLVSKLGLLLGAVLTAIVDPDVDKRRHGRL